MGLHTHGPSGTLQLLVFDDMSSLSPTSCTLFVIFKLDHTVIIEIQTQYIDKWKICCVSLSGDVLYPIIAAAITHTIASVAAITVDVALHLQPPLSPKRASCDRLSKWPATCHAQSANDSSRKKNLLLDPANELQGKGGQPPPQVTLHVPLCILDGGCHYGWAPQRTPL